MVVEWFLPFPMKFIRTLKGLYRPGAGIPAIQREAIDAMIGKGPHTQHNHLRVSDSF